MTAKVRARCCTHVETIGEMPWSFQLSLISRCTLQGLSGTPSKTPTMQKARARFLQLPHSCQTWATRSAQDKGSSCSALLLRPDGTILPGIPAAPQRDVMWQLSPVRPHPLLSQAVATQEHPTRSGGEETAQTLSPKHSFPPHHMCREHFSHVSQSSLPLRFVTKHVPKSFPSFQKQL